MRGYRYYPVGLWEISIDYLLRFTAGLLRRTTGLLVFPARKSRKIVKFAHGDSCRDAFGAIIGGEAMRIGAVN